MYENKGSLTSIEDDGWLIFKDYIADFFTTKPSNSVEAVNGM